MNKPYTSQMLTDVVAQIFLEKAGLNTPNKAVKVSFMLRVDEESVGYRMLDVLIYAPGDHVQVFFRNRSKTTSIRDKENETGDIVYPGKSYVGKWIQRSFFSEAWKTDGLEDFLLRHENEILCFSRDPFYEIVDPTQDPTFKEYIDT